jgi:hypothetical protein
MIGGGGGDLLDTTCWFCCSNTIRVYRSGFLIKMRQLQCFIFVYINWLGYSCCTLSEWFITDWDTTAAVYRSVLLLWNATVAINWSVIRVIRMRLFELIGVNIYRLACNCCSLLGCIDEVINCDCCSLSGCIELMRLLGCNYQSLSEATTTIEAYLFPVCNENYM